MVTINGACVVADDCLPAAKVVETGRAAFADMAAKPDKAYRAM